MRFVRSHKLSDWCLQVIINNLNRFMYNEAIPRKYIDFLLRQYSDEIYRQYSHEEAITEESILWFLNPHNKTVFLPYHAITENVVKRLQVVGSAITSLSLYESYTSAAMLNAVVCCIPHVRHLDFRFSNCTDWTLLCIRKMCPEIETLILSECVSVTSMGMEFLDGCQSLKSLNVMNCNVRSLLSILKSLPSLECLEFRDLTKLLYYVHKDDLKTGACENIKYNLNEFSLSSEDYRFGFEITEAWTTLCPNVKKVYLKPDVDIRVIELCTKFRNLEELNLECYRVPESVSDYVTPFLPLASNIKELVLFGVEIHLVTLLENFKHLNVLYLSKVSFSDFNVEDVKIQETRLKTLAIQNMKVEFPQTSYKAISLIISLSKSVTKLYLNSMNLSQELCSTVINSMKQLRFVDLSFSKLKFKSLKCFFDMPSLRIIYCDLLMGFSLDQDSATKNVLSENCCSLSWHIYDHNVDCSSRRLLKNSFDPLTDYDFDSYLHSFVNNTGVMIPDLL